MTVAACNAAGMEVSLEELSRISRHGSGSSCRSIFGGFAEWKKGDDKESFAVQLADENSFNLRIITALVSTEQRKFDTRGGMKIAKETSPLYVARLDAVKSDLKKMRKAITEKDFSRLGEIAEHETMLLHATAITATPILLYWTPETIAIMHLAMAMREEGVPVYYTTDTGANTHLLTLPEHEQIVVSRLKELNGVQKVHVNKPGPGITLVEEHLF